MVKVRVHLFVSGRVQGVFFREETRHLAENLGVNGWIQNLPGSRVEAVFEGEEEDVKTLVEYCRHGPSRAKVMAVDVDWEPYNGEFSCFYTRWTS
jgi:acylphosphatase